MDSFGRGIPPVTSPAFAGAGYRPVAPEEPCRRAGNQMIDLYNLPLPMIFLGGLTLIWGVSELGWRVATRRSGPSTNINTLEGAMIGLLALIIGFTFSMALSRFEARRSAV